MQYSIQAQSTAKSNASIQIKNSFMEFGLGAESPVDLPNPAEIFLSSLSACILKNLERFSTMMRFDYTKAEVQIDAIRQDRPPKMDAIQYHLKIYSKDEINLNLLKKNIEKFGTIYNTIKSSCTIEGKIEIETEN